MPERLADNDIDATAAVLRSKIASNYEEVAEEIDEILEKVKSLEKRIAALETIYLSRVK